GQCGHDDVAALLDGEGVEVPPCGDEAPPAVPAPAAADAPRPVEVPRPEPAGVALGHVHPVAVRRQADAVGPEQREGDLLEVVAELAPQESAVVADVRGAVGTDGETVRPAAGLRDHLDLALGRDPRDRAPLDLHQQHAPVGHGHRALREQQPGRQLAHIAHEAPLTGTNNGAVTRPSTPANESSRNTTSTGISNQSSLGSQSTSSVTSRTRGSSSIATSPGTYGTLSRNWGRKAWRTTDQENSRP